MTFVLAFLSLCLGQQPDPRETLIEANKQERSILSEIADLDKKLKDLESEAGAPVREESLQWRDRVRPRAQGSAACSM